MLDGEDVLAAVARVCGRLLLELEAGAANLTLLVTPDLVGGAAAPERRRGHAEAVALAVDQPHRGDPLRALVAHQSFLVENGCHDLESSVKLLKPGRLRRPSPRASAPRARPLPFARPAPASDAQARLLFAPTPRRAGPAGAGS